MIKLKCKSPIAYASLDHINPLGTMQDNNRNPLFNQRLYKLYQGRKLNILDLGCAGGAFVKDCIDDGHTAIGLEGSDYSKKHKRAEWATIPDNLFTCDITKPFKLYENGRKMQFDVITAWDVMEHIPEGQINNLIRNIKPIMSPDAIWIMEIDNSPSVHNGIDLHVTKGTQQWWLEKFLENGLFSHNGTYIRYFKKQWVRGKGEKPWSFHLIVKR